MTKAPSSPRALYPLYRERKREREREEGRIERVMWSRGGRVYFRRFKNTPIHFQENFIKHASKKVIMD
jgi:hypothetical protein